MTMVMKVDTTVLFHVTQRHIFSKCERFFLLAKYVKLVACEASQARLKI